MTMLRAGGLLDVLTSLSDCRLQTWNRRKDRMTGTENFGGFVYVLDGFPQRDFVLWVFMCPTNISLFLVLSFLWPSIFHGYHAEGYHSPSLPPRAITPVYAFRLSRHSSLFYSLVITITLHHTRTSGYHTRHSSSYYFIVYLSPAITPPVLLIYTGAPHATTYSTDHIICTSKYLSRMKNQEGYWGYCWCLWVEKTV